MPRPSLWSAVVSLPLYLYCSCNRKPKGKYVIFVFQKERSPTTACSLMAIAQPISGDGPLRSLSPRKDVAAALKEMYKYTRQAVRSGVQLSCTETRFQNCSLSGKNGSKHPMLSISKAHNVISCKQNPKKHSKNQNRRFYYVNLAPELRNDEKLPKKRITQSRFTQFFV